MVSVEQVSPMHVVAIWPRVEPFLARALVFAAGDYTIDQLKAFLVGGHQVLLVADNDGEIVGAATVCPIRYPNATVAFITSVGGRLISNQDLFTQLCDWCRGQGFTDIRGAVRESVARLYRQKFGFGDVYQIVGRQL